MKSSSSSLSTKAADANPEVNRHLSPGCRALACRIVVMPSSGPGRRISATDQRKVFRFDPAQGGTSVPDRRHREPLFGKGFSDPGLRSLVAVNDRISPCTGFIGNSLKGMRDL